MKTLGICLGASTVSLVHLETAPVGKPQAGSGVRIVDTRSLAHEGDPRLCLETALAGLDLSDFDRVAATGRRFRHAVSLPAIPEPQAVETAYRHFRPPAVRCPAVISAGGETFMVYLLDRQGRISDVRTGNKCAAGTGEFFLQQLRRMGVGLEEAARWAVDETPYEVSGRCAVFCKSDCTHATNKGVDRARVTAGLCRMMAGKLLGLLRGIERRDLMLIGGTCRNRMMVARLREEIPGLIIPEAAHCFEALGAALWAREQPAASPPAPGARLFHRGRAAFEILPPLRDAESRVVFGTLDTGRPRAGDACVVGLDVGSTTTKAVVLRRADHALLASVYLRTSGDPVGAARRCYAELHGRLAARVDPERVPILGLGVCGSGRQIAGLHALTDAVYNEIVAHAAAAVFFDPAVDTLFEIGGQDAKYTYIVNGVPADYAMNEACSAGTGSFLEESALETLGVPMKSIAEVALAGDRPPNFNDQCAAFIASDIKTAVHGGVAREDIVAGLVYSVCMNYTNRVRGNRPVGGKVLMQGGVCYNRAVPLAMATLVGSPIVVPPEPGLMGAFGVALEVDRRLSQGRLAERRFDLKALADRRVRHRRPFICRGGRDRCDRRCRIARIELEGRSHPFGGACNRYDNLRRHIAVDDRRLDRVRVRQDLVFDRFAPPRDPGRRGTMGFNRSFLVHTYYPLFAGFFHRLGFSPVLPAVPDPRGIDRRNATFCYPGELAHGFFQSLLDADPRPDHLFLPHFRSVPTRVAGQASQVCPIVQGEPYYLQTAFRDRLDRRRRAGMRVLTPLVDLSAGDAAAGPALVAAARKLGIGRREARRALAAALETQAACRREMQRLGRLALEELETDPDRTAVVLLGRPYNGFAAEAHMGIPRKLASRGVAVLPLDFLDPAGADPGTHMYWGMGQRILQAARRAARHPQLFGVYITNFSCGPDSFLLGYFRTIMGRKPSLTLELDSHTADAGLDNRIEAFLDVVQAYRQLSTARRRSAPRRRFRTARLTVAGGRPHVVTSTGARVPLDDRRVTVLVPSMGRYASEALAAAIRGCGINARAHRPADEAILRLGRANASCKECLPLILTTGTLLDYVGNGRRADEIVVYFMPTGTGPCRFGQYARFTEALVRRLELADVALLSLDSEDAYCGLGGRFERLGWWAVVVSDVMEDMRSMLLAAAGDPGQAAAVFDAQWERACSAIEGGDLAVLCKRLRETALRLGAIPRVRSCENVPVIALTGEIFVRRDGLSRRHLTERLARQGFACACSPIAEWVRYCDYLLERGLNGWRPTASQRAHLALRKFVMGRDERRIKSALAASGLVRAHPVRIRPLIRRAAPLISPHLAGEAILTVGAALEEVAAHACGVIAIGPFGCMPNRLAESLLAGAMTPEGKMAAGDRGDARLRETLRGMASLPFLAIESDGSPFPQLIDARLEAFCLRAGRLHRRMTGAS